MIIIAVDSTLKTEWGSLVTVGNAEVILVCALRQKVRTTIMIVITLVKGRRPEDVLVGGSEKHILVFT
jgi:hypothetical protein